MHTVGIEMCQDDASTKSADTGHHVCPVQRLLTRTHGIPGRRTYRRQEEVNTFRGLVPTVQLVLQQLVYPDCVSFERVQRP